MNGGTIQCWGFNNYGEIGNGTNLLVNSLPVPVIGITNAIAVAASTSHTCAVLNDNTVQCWGLNHDGQLGDGTTTDSSVPVTVTGF
jgi:alpha-tubulin suppressor-like RCC1 family protein